MLTSHSMTILSFRIRFWRKDPTIPQAPTPIPTRTLAPVATPTPTGIISERTRESATEDLLDAHRIEPYLIGNLLFIAHWGEDVQRWFVYDVSGAFTSTS